MLEKEKKATNIIVDIAYIIILAAIVYACYGLFFNMALNTDGNFKSDLPYYISKANEETIRYNRLPYVLFRVLYRMTGNMVGIGVFLALTVGGLIVANRLFIKDYVRANADNSKLRLLICAASIATIFTGPIYCPDIQPWFYRKLLPIFAWQSPTQQIMTLCAVMGMVFFFRMFDEYEERIQFKWWLATAAMFLLSAYAKPSFIIDLAPSVVVVFLIELICKTGLGIGDKFKRLFLMGLSLVPAGIYILYLRNIIYISADRAGDGEVLLNNSGFSDIKHLVFAALFSWLFPIIVSLVNIKRLFSDRKFDFSVMLCVMGLLQAELLAETGRRANHGNFEWGKIIGAYMLTLTCMAIALDNYRDKEFLSGNKVLRCGYFALLAVALALQVGSQGYYFYTMCLGGGYWR